MCFGGGSVPDLPKPVAAPVPATSVAKRNNLESKARRSFASTLIGQSNREQASRLGDLKELIGS